MLFAGIDYHKRYSVVHVLDAAGATVKKGRIEPNSLGGLAGFFSGFPAGSVRAVFESSMNWGYLYDLLHEVEAVADETLANPYKTRVIAEAKIKTDKLDGRPSSRRTHRRVACLLGRGPPSQRAVLGVSPRI
jgi:transposase